jgi:hypothetical protein
MAMEIGGSGAKTVKRLRWFVVREKHCCLVADKPCVHGLGSDIRLRHGGVIAGRGVASGYRDKKERMAWI